MSAEELKVCLEQLNELKTALKDITVLISDKPVLHGLERIEAQDRLRKVKEDIMSYHNSMFRVRGEEALTDAEQRYYRPAIHEAVSFLRININSTPGRDWLNNIYDATHALEWYTNSIERELASEGV